MRRRNVVLGAAAALLLLAGGWYLGSPWWTLWRMREAARAGDVKTLATYIDQPALVANATGRARRIWGSVLTTKMADTQTARDFVAFARRKLAGLDGKPGPGPADLLGWLSEMPIGPGGRRRGDPVVIRRGLDRFEVRDRGVPSDFSPLLRFRRHGLGWKLEDARWGQQ
jgi:hypothetical protein